RPARNLRSAGLAASSWARRYAPAASSNRPSRRSRSAPPRALLDERVDPPERLLEPRVTRLRLLVTPVEQQHVPHVGLLIRPGAKMTGEPARTRPSAGAELSTDATLSVIDLPLSCGEGARRGGPGAGDDRCPGCSSARWRGGNRAGATAEHGDRG